MDRELESMSDLARQSDSQLRCADSCSLTHNAVNSVVILPPDPPCYAQQKGAVFAQIPLWTQAAQNGQTSLGLDAFIEIM